MELQYASLIAALLLFSFTAASNDNRFQIVEENENPYELIETLNFAIEPDTTMTGRGCAYLNITGSELRTAQTLDREEIMESLKDDVLVCTIQSSNSLFETIEVKVLDINDNRPRFNELGEVHSVTIPENFEVPNVVVRLDLVDRDNGENGTADFYIAKGNEEHFFYIGFPLDQPPSDHDVNRQMLYFNRTVDYEMHQQFNLTIQVNDRGTPRQSFTQIIIIHITNVNDEPLAFIISNFTFLLSQTHPVSPTHPFGNVSALDSDSSSINITYTLGQRVPPIPDNTYTYIDINTTSGELFLKEKVSSFDVGSTFIFSVEVQDTVQDVMDSTQVFVTITDGNNDRPSIERTLEINAEPENKEGIVLPFKIGGDDDGIDEERIVIDIHPPIKIYQTVTKRSNFVFVFLTFNQSLDREQIQYVNISLTAYDKGDPPFGSTIHITLQILDENDNSPNFTQDVYYNVIGEGAPLGKTVMTVKANDPDYAENGRVSYAITSVSPLSAQWFNIDPVTGIIRVNGTQDYKVAESVTLYITASDNGSIPRLGNTTVEIKLSPAVTFEPRSYQEHYSLNFKTIEDASKIYLEFQTSQENGLLIYDETEENNFILEIEDGMLKCRSPQHSLYSTVNVSNNQWISVLYDSEQKMLEVWQTETENETKRAEILLTSEVNTTCSKSTQATDDHTFFVGGVDLFSRSIRTTDFVGNIRNLIIDSVQVDLSCPLGDQNTIHGAVFSHDPACSLNTIQCTESHYQGCSDYATESQCICGGGFHHKSCSEENSYDPIQLTDASLTMQLNDYSFYYDLELSSMFDSQQQKKSSTSTPSRNQLVEFQFRPLQYSDKDQILLFSKTESGQHTLEISESMSEYTFTYQVHNKNSVPVAHLSKTVNYELGKLYRISIALTHADVTLSFNDKVETINWTGSFVPFAEYPNTIIVLGGADDPETSTDFAGCITQLSVNGIQFPLNGLLKTNDSSFMQVRSSGGVDGVSTQCDLCQRQPQPCPGTSICVSNTDSYECTCPQGQMLNSDGSDCVPIPSIPPEEAGVSESTDQIPLYYFISGGVIVVILIVIGLLLIIFIIRFRRYKKQAKKQTYRVGGDPHLNMGSLPRSKPNSYTTVTRQQSDRSSSEPAFVTASQLTHESSASTNTYKEEHDIDEDIESGSNMQTMTRSKLSTSGETGFQTASERDVRSIPRMEDSGNEKDTDYSPCDSESDDMEYQSSYMEAVTHGIHVSDTGQARGVSLPSFSSSDPISCLGAPHTWKEKKLMVPLRPDSQSELDEETDLDTDFSSTNLPKLSRVYQTPLKSPPSITPDTGVSGHHQWYKSSTFSDNERERVRAEDYYPTYREPPQAYENSRLPPLRSISSPANPRIPSSRPKQRGYQYHSPPISSLTTSYNHNTLPSSLSHSHTKARENNINENSKVSASILSQSQPLKYNHPLFKQSSAGSTRIREHLAPHSYNIPSFIRCYSDESSMKGGEKRFVDLGSVRTNCDPIQYWEGQRRMMPTVDQVESYQVLSESFTPFNDSAADLSENKSQLSIPDHSTFLNQGGGEGTAESIDINLLRLRDFDEDSTITGTTLKGSETGSKVLHFPSADCSEEYRRASSMSSAMSPNHPMIIEHSCSVPPSQGAFEV